MMIFIALLVTISISHSLPISQQPVQQPLLMTQPTETPAALTRDYVQGTACAIDRLRKSVAKLPYVELQPCPSAGYSCVPEMSNDLLTQMDIVSGYAEYIATEEIIYGNYSAPDELLDLLDTLNDTLTSLPNSEMNLTSQSNFWPNVPVCEDDATFQSNCTVHLLNSSLHRLTQLYQSTLPTCTFCTSLSEDEQAEMNELYLFFSGDYLDQLLPFQCRFVFYFAQYQLPLECTSDTYTLHGRLSNLTQWMNVSLAQLNQSRPDLETLVHTLTAAILPSTDRALNGLRQRDDCIGSTRCTAPGLELELVEAAASQFALEECFPEPNRLHLATVTQIFDLMRQTFNSFYRHLLFEEIITL